MIRTFLLALAVIGQLSCVSVREFALRSRADWKFVQAVGGISVDKAVRDASGHVLLEYRCDVSGLTTVTIKPTALNSGLVCIAPDTKVTSRRIDITIRTTVAGGAHTSRCPSADLGDIGPGTYAVDYLSSDGSRNGIGQVRVPSR